MVSPHLQINTKSSVIRPPPLWCASGYNNQDKPPPKWKDACMNQGRCRPNGHNKNRSRRPLEPGHPMNYRNHKSFRVLLFHEFSGFIGTSSSKREPCFFSGGRCRHAFRPTSRAGWRIRVQVIFGICSNAPTFEKIGRTFKTDRP